MVSNGCGECFKGRCRLLAGKTWRALIKGISGVEKRVRESKDWQGQGARRTAGRKYCSEKLVFLYEFLSVWLSVRLSFSLSLSLVSQSLPVPVARTKTAGVTKLGAGSLWGPLYSEPLLRFSGQSSRPRDTTRVQRAR